MTAFGAMFHHFYDDSHPMGQGAISGQEFCDIIDHLGRESILPAEEWLRRALTDSLEDNDICLTFDDALRCQYDVAYPIMKDMGLTGLWFVYSSVFEGNNEALEVYRYFRTVYFSKIEDFYDAFFLQVRSTYPEEYTERLADFKPENYLAADSFYTEEDRIFRFLRDDVLGVERYHPIMLAMMDEKDFDPDSIRERLWMNDSCLVALQQDAHVIGLHSYTHPTRMKELSASEQHLEYKKNTEHLGKVLGNRPVCMSHPCNSYNDVTLSALKKLGIQVGFRAYMDTVPSWTQLEYPRVDHAMIMREIKA